MRQHNSQFWLLPSAFYTKKPPKLFKEISISKCMRNTVSTVCENQKFDMALQRIDEETPHINHNKLYCKSEVEFTSYVGLELKSFQCLATILLRKFLIIPAFCMK